MKFRSSIILSLGVIITVLLISFLAPFRTKQNEDVRKKLLQAIELMENNDGKSAKEILSSTIPDLEGDQFYPYFTTLMAMVNYGFLTETSELFRESKAILNKEFHVVRDGKLVGTSKLSCLIIPSAYGMKMNGTKDLERKLQFLRGIMEEYAIGFKKGYCDQSALGPGDSDIRIENSFYESFPQ